MRINNRIIQILRIVSKIDKPVTSYTICEELNITSRTLRNDLIQNKEYLRINGIKIISRSKLGYELDVIDERKYYDFIKNQCKESYQKQLVIPIYPEDRVQYLIKKFLIADTYIKVDDLCDEIFVSRSTLNNDLKEVREKITFFRLDLETKPSYGVKLVGSEFHKRSCMAQYFFHIDDHDNEFLMRTKSTSPMQEEISMMLYECMEEETFRLTDIGFQNLVIHIMIAINRLKEKVVSDSTGYEKYIEDTPEYVMANKVCDKLEKYYQVIFPEIERYYIALHLSGKKAMQYTTNNVMLHDATDVLLQKIFKKIKDEFHIHLAEDIELYTSLSLHFQPMLNRLKYGMHIQNPLLDQIKKNNMESFEMGIVTADIIQKEKGYLVSENEIGYIALHFALAVERHKNDAARKDIIIVCASGMGSSQILLHKVRQKFRDSIGKIKVIEQYALHTINQSDYDFILTTIPISFKTKIPVIFVQYFLDVEDNYQIQDALFKSDTNFLFIDQYFSDELFFTDLEGKSKEQLISEMCKRTKEYKELPDNFEEEVLKREQYSVTEFGNAIAIPHPMKPMAKETFVSIGVLPRTIRWQNQNVKFIFLLCIEKDGKESLSLFHTAISALVMDKNALSAFEKNPSVKLLKRLLKEKANTHKENDIDVLFS